MYKEIIKCTQYDLLRTKAKVGQLYFVTDARILYKDNGNSTAQRLVFNAIVLHTDYERQRSVRPIVGKFYYIEETNCLWLYDTRWILKVGNTTNYNTYYSDDYISPVIYSDESISGIYGDKVIDNNGLLGDGSVVIRDYNRMTRGLFKSNMTHNYLELKSYLDDGLLFIPNAHLPYNDLTSSLGALHLTVEKKDVNNSLSLKLNGSAHYYGNWNNYGDMFLIQQDSNSMIYPDYVPINDYEIVKFYVTCTKTVNLNKMTTHFIIRPISDSLAIAHIISVNDENSHSVVQNDMGELIFTHDGDLVDNTVIECKRKIISNGDYKISQYIFDNYNDTITIKQQVSSVNRDIEIGETWCDSTDEITSSVTKWIKDEVITRNTLEKEINELKNEINRLKNK